VSTSLSSDASATPTTPKTTDLASELAELSRRLRDALGEVEVVEIKVGRGQSISNETWFRMRSVVNSIGDKMRDAGIVRQGDNMSPADRIRALVNDARDQCLGASAGQPFVQEATFAHFLQLWATLTSEDRATLRGEFTSLVAADLHTEGAEAMNAVVRAKVTNDFINITKHQG
jgi:hypothetical protein